ncbi:MAG: hypothetical protein F4089_06445 [Gammaproteobacteria bacterium]|nr:hypothetical protein [Gammaproteobacteria bacterium]MYJ74751.1 hypothetical protein [Gammaproteobacteria bacterium]
MPGLNQQADVEVVEVEDDLYDLIPLTKTGSQALSSYLGHPVLGIPVRMTNDQYRDFNKYARTYAQKHRTRFSTSMKREFRGQRQVDQADLDVLDGTTELPRELQERLFTDSRFLVLSDHNFSVLPMRYGPPIAGQLYKVTKPDKTPRRSGNVSLGTLDYYRNTTDEHEASFTVDNPRVTIRNEDGKVIARPGDVLSASYSLNPCWIYCTTILDDVSLGSGKPAWDGLEATPIVSSIEHFAYMLGAAFGVWSKPRVREVYADLESVEILQGTMSGIMVMHGPVRYIPRNERNEHLNELSRRDSPLVLPESVFTKSDEFSWEREYRFGVFGWGSPLQNHVILPVVGEVLDCYGHSLAISG